jgi:small-conductance mechanosensitive channel
MPRLSDLSSLPLFGNSLLRWLIACALVLVVLFVLLGLRRALRGYYKRMQATAHTEVLEVPLQVLSGTTLLFFVVVALFVGAQALVMPAPAVSIATSAITIALFWQAGAWAVKATSVWLERKRRQNMATDRAAVGSLGIIGFILNVLIWGMVVLLTLDNLGVNITALVAGLGIGGIAVALAVQNVLGDLFASLSITLDRPFVIGDFLIVGDFLGSVEYIGIKSTRLRSLNGEQIIISNADLLKARVHNFKRMRERRYAFSVGITYETSRERLAEVPAIVEAAVRAQPKTRFDRCHLLRFGDSALVFETVYIVTEPDYRLFADTQQAINFRLLEEFEERGIQFAYPTQRTISDEAVRNPS